MSDLEQVASRAPIVSSAVGKLRSLTGSTGRFGETEGLVDAFAEVFAQMAIAAPPPVQPSQPTANRQDESEEAASPSSERSDEDTYQDQSSDENRTESIASEPILNNDPLPDQANELRLDQGSEVSVEADAPTDSPPETEATTVATSLPGPQATAGDPETNVERDTNTQEAANQVAEVDVDVQRRNRRESTANRSGEPIDGGDQPFEIGSEKKLSSIQSDQTEATGAGDPVLEEGTEATEPAHRTTRQAFLETRRRQPHGGESQGNQHSADNGPQPTDALPSPPVDTAAPEGTPIQSVAGSRTTAVTAQANGQANAASAIGVATNTSQGTNQQRVETRTETPIQTENGTRPDRAATRETRSSTQESSQASTAARVKLVQRVSRAFQHLGPEGGIIRLRLAPAELGSVKIEMQIHQRKVQARVVAETEAASAALREHLPELRARLESYGMQVEQLEIETESNEGQSGSPFDRHTQNESDQQSSRHRRATDEQPVREPRPGRFSNETPTTDRVAVVSQGVDLRL